MSYIAMSLLPGEQVVHRTYLSKWIFLGPGILLFIGFAIWTACAWSGISFLQSLVVNFPFLIGGSLLFLERYIRFTTSEFAITDRRVIIKVGFLSQRTLELQLSKLEAVAVSQGIWARMFGYGDIVVTGTGGTKEPFRAINDPAAFRRAAQAAAP